MRKYLFLAGALALGTFAMDAQAQSTGTVQIIGSVNPVGAIRWWAWTPANAGIETGVNTPNTQNQPLDFSIDVSDVAAGNNLNDVTGGNVTVILRSNEAYRLFAEVTASNNFGLAANGDLELDDIGVGFTNLTGSGDGSRRMTAPDPVAASTIIAGYDVDPTSVALEPVNFEPDWVGGGINTLGTLNGGSVEVVNGPRISRRGGRNSPNNGLLLDVGFALSPLYYSPVASWDATVELTMLTP